MMFVILSALIHVAQAGPVEAAEHRRLADEMKAAAQRSLWSAVDEGYQKVAALEERGEPLSVEDHWLGAQAARALGDIAACRARLDRAARAGGSRDVIAWLEEVDATYGHLRVNMDPAWTGDRAVVPASPPFAPDQRAAIDFAGRALAVGSFDGLVPAGSYTVAGQPVEVVTGDKVAALSIVAPKVEEARPSGPYRLAYAGPRATFGYAYTAMGGLTGAGASADAGLQAAGFAGSGARVGLGLEVGFTRHVGAIAEVGYHNLLSGAKATGLADSETYTTGGSSLHLGYGWLAASLRFGDLWIAAGPLWAAGGASATGVDGYCVSDTGADAAAPCSEDYPYLREEDAAYQRLNGKITAGGGALGLSYGIVDIGSLRGAISVNGGMQTDSFRWYPWGQAGFTIAPASARKGKDG